MRKIIRGATARQADEGVKRLTPDEFRAVLEAKCQRALGMTYAEFVEAFRAGRLRDNPDAMGLAVLSGEAARPIA